ncbi:MAG: regulatory iron-sulfur-containing complex subunit RicT [bacterium]
MRIAEVKITEWDSPQIFELKEDLGEIKKCDFVIIEDTLNNTPELGEILDIKEIEKRGNLGEGENNIIKRKANQSDLADFKTQQENKSQYFEYCRECIGNLKLEMKLVDVYVSYDGQRIIFAFISEGRVDFRELVKMLNRRFRKSIRMHQIGIRDEAKVSGNLGVCGRDLCCKKFLKELASVGSEAAEVQQISHRGADRISGICGRLMCCLNYEKDGYKELSAKLPSVGSKVTYEGKEYAVLGWNVLKQTINLKIDDGVKIEVEVGKLKF